MAPPNTLFIPVVARPHAQAAFTEVMRALDEDVGLFDQYDDNAVQGGLYLHVPRHGRFNTAFIRADTQGTVTTAVTPSTLTYKDQVAPVLFRTMVMRHYSTEPQVAYKLTNEQFSAEIGRQIGLEAALQMISDAYKVAIASLYTVGTSHRYTIASTMSATIIQAGKTLMGDNQRMLDVGFMHSAQFSALTQSVLTPASPGIVMIFGEVFKTGNPTAAGCVGINWIVDDRIPTNGGYYRALAFRSRKASNTGNAPMFMAVQRPLEIYTQHYTAQQSVYFDQQPQIAYGIGTYGKGWDVTGAGANPVDGTLTNAANWLDAYASAVASGHKEVGGVLYETN